MKIKINAFLLVLFSTFFIQSGSTLAIAAEEKLEIGRFKSRAIWTPISNQDPKIKSPVVILVPGSGPNGPEEMVPPSYTADGKNHSLFAEFSEPLHRAEISTLALGKPGIEFFTEREKGKFFYDKDLYMNLRWPDLLSNLSDAVDFVRKQEGVDPNRIYILGHSEGTQVAIDFAKIDSSIKGILLLGYAGEDLATIVDWQLFRRDIDSWLAPDVDTNHDLLISKEEAAKWPEFVWDWKSDAVSFPEIETALRNEKELKNIYEEIKNVPLYADGIFTRGPNYEQAAALKTDVFVYTGSLDVQTRPEEALALKNQCAKVQKNNCFVSIVPGLGHGFAPPKGPRAQKYLDAVLGPVDPLFQNILYNWAIGLANFGQ